VRAARERRWVGNRTVRVQPNGEECTAAPSYAWPMSLDAGRAPIVLIVVVVAGLMVRGWHSPDAAPLRSLASSAALDSQRARVSSASARGRPAARGRRRSAKGSAGEDAAREPAAGGTRKRRASRTGGADGPPPIVDLESADATTIETLPRIGPALARRIVEDRAAHGPFRSLEGLQRVRGVGPAIARQLLGHVTFGGAGRPSDAEPWAS
jgi:competence protein ComEA